jgi:hypothetical protein
MLPGPRRGTGPGRQIARRYLPVRNPLLNCPCRYAKKLGEIVNGIGGLKREVLDAETCLEKRLLRCCRATHACEIHFCWAAWRQLIEEPPRTSVQQAADTHRTFHKLSSIGIPTPNTGLVRRTAISDAESGIWALLLGRLRLICAGLSIGTKQSSPISGKSRICGEIIAYAQDLDWAT